MSEQDPERALVRTYAPARSRPALDALLALDDALGQLLRTTREPMLGRIRLAWWRERIAELDTAPPPAEPVLQGLAGVVANGIPGRDIAALADGWEALLDDPLDDAALTRHGDERGAALFALAGRALGAAATDPLAAAGRGWALADLAAHLSDPATAARARELASAALAQASGVRWSRDARALGAMAQLARLDLALEPGAPRPAGAPRRVARVLWHRLTGR